MSLPHFPLWWQHLWVCSLSTPLHQHHQQPIQRTQSVIQHCRSADRLLTDRKRHKSMRKHRVSFYQIFSHLWLTEKAEKHISSDLEGKTVFV